MENKLTQEDIKQGFIGFIDTGKKLHINPYSEFNKGLTREEHLSAVRLYKSLPQSTPKMEVEISKRINIHCMLADKPFFKSNAFENEEDDNTLIKGGEGSRGGKVIGRTKSGKPIYQGKSLTDEPYSSFTKEDRQDFFRVHGRQQHQEELDRKIKESNSKSAAIRKKSNESELDIEKGGKRVQVGEVRVWQGITYVKHADGWVYVKKDGTHMLERPGGKREVASQHHTSHYTTSKSKYEIKPKGGDKENSGQTTTLTPDGGKPKDVTTLKESTNKTSNTSNITEVYNKKNKELSSVIEKLDSYTKGSLDLEGSQVLDLKQKKEILTQIVKKLESKLKVTTKLKEDPNAKKMAEKDQE